MQTEQELKKLPRKQLIQMILDLNKESEDLKAEVSQLKSRLSDKSITLDNAGSIAEASMQLNDVFAQAQKAADQYLQNIKDMNESQRAACEQRDAESKAESERLVKEAGMKSDAMLKDAKEQSEAMVRTAKEKSESMVSTAKEQSLSYWSALQNKLEAFYNAHNGLKQLLEIPAVMVGQVEGEKEDIYAALAQKAEESTNRLFNSMSDVKTIEDVQTPENEEDPE